MNRNAAMTSEEIQARLRQVADPRDAIALQSYFKTGPGGYGEGDIFIGVKVPKVRKLVKEVWREDESVVRQLLASAVHEDRFLALMMLVRQFEKGSDADRARIFHLYLSSTDRINNWDLVDLSAPGIVGGYLVDKSRRPLYRLAESKSLWERRIAILATFAFIRTGDFADALAIGDRLLPDREDLIHKAVGWMLREIGKRDVTVLEAFLKPRLSRMPRTMLRYAIERFPEAKRQWYLRGAGATPDGGGSSGGQTGSRKRLVRSA
jgi:3-methyladenine DNA glycosylase AlkD